MRKMILKIVFVIAMAVSLVQNVNAATLYFYPENLEVVTGGSFIVELRLDTEGESVNAFDIKGSHEGATCIIESVSIANSVIDIIIDSSISDDGQTFRFSGGTPNGFNGEGIVGRLAVTAGAPGEHSITLSQESKLLIENALEVSDLKLRPVTYSVLPPSANHIVITSRSHPDQNKWYGTKDLHLHWDLEDGASYSYEVSLDPAAVPDETPDKPAGTLIWQGDININGLEEGIYYFTLKRIGEEGIARYRAMIDTTAPEWTAFEVSEGVPETQYNKFVTFLAKDTVSGINRYEVKVDDEDPVKVIAPYILPDDYLQIKISAFDNAGNEVSRTVTSGTQRGIFTLYIVVAIIVLGAVVVLIAPIRRRIFTKIQ